MNYKFKAIIFDFDDTLIDAKSQGIDFHIQVARRNGWRVPPKKEIFKYWGLGWEEFVRNLWPEVPFRDFERAYIEYRRTRKREYRLIPGAKRTVKKLQKMNFVMGILSNRNEKNVRDLLESLGVNLDYFDIIQGEEEYFYHKPDPRAFDNILSTVGKKGITPQEVLYIGDTIFDVTASQGKDLKFIGVLSGVIKRKGFRSLGIKDKDIIKSIKDLPRWLRKYGKIDDR